MKPIINAHTHLLSHLDIPVGFPNKVLAKIANTKIGFKLLSGVLHNLNPFSNKDALDKLLTFVKASRIGSEMELFNDVRAYYPSTTKFVALMMNMHHMGAGRCRRTYLQSLLALDSLRKIFPEKVLPFYMADCRDENCDNFFDDFVLKRGWTGVKMYPPLGTWPQDARYEYIYEKCQERNIPIISHCTYGNPVHYKGSKSELDWLLLPFDEYEKKLGRKGNCDKFTNPDNWAKVAAKFPGLKICLAHAGGSKEWEQWLKQPSNENNLLNKIINIMAVHKNVYMDISFTANKDFAADVLFTLMTEPKFEFLHDRILFGSDWYMNLSETTEAEWSIGLRRKIGVQIFDKIARENTHKFLNI